MSGVHLYEYIGERETICYGTVYGTAPTSPGRSARALLSISVSPFQLLCYIIVSPDHIFRTATHKGAKFPPASA